MDQHPLARTIALAWLLWAVVPDAFAEHEKDAGVVTITASTPTSLPTQVPATMEGLTARQIETQVNATDSEDALKYLPSLLVRKRYMGDYNHAILSSRTSGTGNSARSAVYADGILLSNYLGNGVSGLGFPPRWGMVTPDEIERVDVMYGPFSAAYPGNSVGAVVDYTTRMPDHFEGSVKLGYAHQPFDLYSTHASYGGWQSGASLGNRSGDWAWRLDFNHSDSQGQPLTFVTSTTQPTATTGAVTTRNKYNASWYILGSGTQYHTVQDHFKAKLAYDLGPTVRASYTLASWENTSQGRPATYLRDDHGQPVYAGGNFALSNERLQHTLHGLSVKSLTQSVFDWEVAASMYNYGQDDKRSNAISNPLPNAATGGAGSIADGSGTGWNNLALRGIWRPDGLKGEHVLNFGAQLDHYRLRYLTSNISGNWQNDAAGTVASEVGGRTQLQSVYVQDTWRFAPWWRAVLGVRSEHWQAQDGLTRFSADSSQPFASRSGRFLSPKGALSWQLQSDAFVKYAVGRAVRMPTVNELYGATLSAQSSYINDPNLRPEKSWTQELSYEKTLDHHQWRLTAFAENTHDGIFSQSVVDLTAVPNKTISRVQNVDYIVTKGLEAVFNSSRLWLPGLDLSASVTYADSTIRENNTTTTVQFTSNQADTIGKRQPNIPRWRATLVAAYRYSAEWSSTVAVRHSGQQFNTLNNSDINGHAYMGVSPFTTVDVRIRWQIDPRWSTAFGIDNLTNQTYWNFHPYPQRSYTAELKARL
ncbi:MAG: TonB-dependent receptor [Limnohabitans sp.]